MDRKLDTKLVCAKSHRAPSWAYLDGRIVPYKEARFGILTHALNYGTGLFAGLRAFWNRDEGQLFVFRPEDHFRRFIDSARLLRMELPFSPADLTRGVIDLLKAEGYREDIYIRPLAFYGDETIGVRLHDLTPRVAIAALPMGNYLDRDDGAHVCFSSWRRVSDNTIPPRGKLAGSYVNSALAKTDAVLAGFDETIMLNEPGHVCEGSVANLFVVRGGKVLTPAVNDDILEGITRATLIELLRDELSQEVIERSIDRTEVYLADEVFFAGTGLQLVPITRVDHRAIGTGKPGPITRSLRALYADVVRGRLPKHRARCRPVYSSGAGGEKVEALTAAGDAAGGNIASTTS